MTGGAGGDKFGFQVNFNTLAQEDTITDFTRNQGDNIQLGTEEFSSLTSSTTAMTVC